MKMMMSRKELCSNYLEEPRKHSLKVVEEDLEVKSTFYLSVIPQLRNLKFYNMFIRLLQEEFTHQVKDLQRLVLLRMFQKIQKREKTFLNQEP